LSFNDLIDRRDAAPNGHPDRCPVCGTPVGPSPGQDSEPCPSCGHLLWFTSEREGDVTVVHLSNNRVALMELLELLDHAVLDGLVGKLLLDFGGIQQVSSAALGRLVKLVSHAHSVRGSLKLCDLHSDMRQVFRITRLDSIFSLYDTRDDALAAFGSGA